MKNNLEIEGRVTDWTGREHFRTPIAALIERKPFTARVTEYIDLLRQAFPSESQVESIIPLEGASVDGAGIPFLTDFMKDLHADSLAVFACNDQDGRMIGVGAMKGGQYYGGLFIEPKASRIRFFVSTTENGSPAYMKVSERMRKEFKGFPGFQKQLQAADTLFTFIVFQTLQQVREKVRIAPQ